jgi:hypothetical protein
LKKLTIIVSFILISLFSVGSYFLHQIYLKGYKKEFKTYISQHKEQSDFSTVTINPSQVYNNSAQIIWEDEYTEVIYEGILYDVVSVNGKGLTVELTLVSDYQEMELKRRFTSFYDISSSENTKKPFDLLKNIFALKYIVHSICFDLNNITFTGNTFVKTPDFLIINRVISIHTPPPDFFCNF